MLERRDRSRGAMDGRSKIFAKVGETVIGRDVRDDLSVGGGEGWKIWETSSATRLLGTRVKDLSNLSCNSPFWKARLHVYSRQVFSFANLSRHSIGEVRGRYRQTCTTFFTTVRVCARETNGSRYSGALDTRRLAGVMALDNLCDVTRCSKSGPVW